jgi:hypothetical protein
MAEETPPPAAETVERFLVVGDPKTPHHVVERLGPVATDATTDADRVRRVEELRADIRRRLGDHMLAIPAVMLTCLPSQLADAIATKIVPPSASKPAASDAPSDDAAAQGDAPTHLYDMYAAFLAESGVDDAAPTMTSFDRWRQHRDAWQAAERKVADVALLPVDFRRRYAQQLDDFFDYSTQATTLRCKLARRLCKATCPQQPCPQRDDDDHLLALSMLWLDARRWPTLAPEARTLIDRYEPTLVTVERQAKQGFIPLVATQRKYTRVQLAAMVQMAVDKLLDRREAQRAAAIASSQPAPTPIEPEPEAAAPATTS